MPQSYITPSIVGVRSELKSVTCGLVLHSLLYGVISGRVDLLVYAFILLVVIQISNSCKYVCCVLSRSCVRVFV